MRATSTDTSSTTQTFTIAVGDVDEFDTSAVTYSDAAGNTVTPNTIIINDNDGDDMADDWESANGISDPSGDADSDNLNNLGEYNNNTNPSVSDTDGDGLADGWEVTYGLDPSDSAGVNGGGGDLDGDGWTTPCDCDDSSPERSPEAVEVCERVGVAQKQAFYLGLLAE